MNKIRNFFKDYSDELVYKVHWPTIPELQSSTITVLVASLMIAFVIFAFDFGFGSILRFLYGMIG